MSFVSYAQNYEDLRLWRALRHIEHGCYLDVGAQHPVLDSVSKAFYDAGWRGAHVEPTPFYAAALREDRPDERVFEVAVGNAGTMPFYEFPETGLSTGVAEIARLHSEAGFPVRLRQVPVVPLSKLFADFGAETIHWMKVDVEGMERDVISTWGDSSIRPWALVIESVHPATHEPTEGAWLELLLARGYEEVAFDGLSRYFVASEHSNLGAALAAPPQIFDDFEVTRYHFSSRRVVAEFASITTELEGSLAQLQAQTDTARLRIESLESSASALAAERASLEAQLAEETANSRRIAAELEQVREGLAAELADERANTSSLKAELADERANTSSLKAELEQRVATMQGQVAAAEQSREKIRAELERRVSEISDQVAASEQERQRIVAELEKKIIETQDRLAEAAKERDSALAEAAAHRSAAIQADALIRDAVQSRAGRWRRFGESIGVVRPGPAWRALADWSLPATFSSLSSGRHGNEMDQLSTMNSPSSINTGNPYLRANSLQELLSWDDVDFVRCAYVTVLGRQPDPEGEAHYTDRIRCGHSKMEVLWQLRRSDEARGHDPGIAGLDRALRWAAWGRTRLLGWAVRPFTHTEDDSARSRQHRAILNGIAVIRVEQERQRLLLTRTLPGLAQRSSIEGLEVIAPSSSSASELVEAAGVQRPACTAIDVELDSRARYALHLLNTEAIVK
ncbi:MAG: FkbM family methyltransferase [Sphingomicrobium sp.]